MRRVRVLVSGLVQGVGYRFTTRAEAEQRGLSGWVRNLRDGRVEAEVQGPDAAVDAMLDWMRQGPPGARIDDLVTADADTAAPAEFEVRATV